MKNFIKEALAFIAVSALIVGFVYWFIVVLDNSLS
jgi:hypothetical protein